MTAQQAFKRVWKFLTRLKVAAVLILILLLLTALGSCFPQTPTSTAAGALWQTGLRARYGPLTDALAAIGVFRWFRSPLFLVSLALPAVATLVCTLDRWRSVWRRAFRVPGVTAPAPQAAALDAAPYQARLTGLRAADLPHALSTSLEERGFRVRSRTIGDVFYVRGDRNRLAALATLATHLAALLLLLGTLLSIGLCWRETLSLEPKGRAGLSHRSRLLVRNEGFDIERYTDGTAAAYQARVTILEGAREVMRGSVGVNQPLRYRDVGFYLRGYAQQPGGYRLSLLAVHDPGYGPVVAAGFLLLLGLTLSLYFPRSWVQARIEAGDVLHLAGWAERRACDFGRQFAALVEELEPWKA